MTVANHISTLDDPLLMSCILPTSVNLVPEVGPVRVGHMLQLLFTTTTR